MLFGTAKWVLDVFSLLHAEMHLQWFLNALHKAIKPHCCCLVHYLCLKHLVWHLRSCLSSCAPQLHCGEMAVYYISRRPILCSTFSNISQDEADA